MRIWPGRSYPLGATWDGRGTNFALYAENATKVEVCGAPPMLWLSATRARFTWRGTGLFFAILNAALNIFMNISAGSIIDIIMWVSFGISIHPAYDRATALEETPRITPRTDPSSQRYASGRISAGYARAPGSDTETARVALGASGG